MGWAADVSIFSHQHLVASFLQRSATTYCWLQKYCAEPACMGWAAEVSDCISCLLLRSMGTVACAFALNFSW